MSPWAPLTVAILGWGMGAVLGRAIVGAGVSTFTMLPFRLSIALLTLLAISPFSRRFLGRTRAAWGRGAILGVVAMGIPMALMTLGLEDLPVTVAGLLIALIPVTTVLAAHFVVDGERFNARSLPGLLTSLIGTGFLVGVGGETAVGVGDLGRGVTVTVVGVTLAGLGGALIRRFALEVGGDALVMPQFVVATIVLYAAMPLFGTTTVAAITPAQWALIAALGAVGTAIPFASFLIAAQINPASRLALSGYLVPVISLTLAIVFLGERLTPEIVTGAVLIIGGVVMAERASPRLPLPETMPSR